jgi:hypothetical protein
MAAKGNKLAEILLTAIRELQTRSSLPPDERWFTRADIARQLNVKSQKLNPRRVSKLEELVDGGEVLKRQKPNDGRDLPQYQIA